MHERRTSKRWQVNKRALLKLRQASGEIYCQIRDLNFIGTQLILHTKLPLDARFKLNLRLSQDCTIDAKAWVSWHKVIDGSNHYGLYFSEIRNADKEKIEKFINSVYPNDLSGTTLQPENESQNQEGGEMMNDHRIFERFKKEFSARYIGLDGKEGVAQTFDVSAKGIGLSTNQELESRANLELWLNVPNSTDPLYTRGQVVWTRSNGDGGYRSGIELERANLMGIARLLRA